MKNNLLLATIFVVLPCLTGLLATPGSLNAQVSFSGKTMGPITYNVVVNETVEDETATTSGIQGQLDQVNNLMSTYIDSSDVSRFNTAKAGEWVDVDPLTLQVVARAIELGKLTDGAFDITVGPAVKRWKFGPDANKIKFPTDAEVEQLSEFVGIDKVELRTEPPAIRKLHDQTEIDLSAIAKGFAVDHVANWLQDRGHSNFMIEVGGEVIVQGAGPKGKWRIGIEKPNLYGQAIAAVLELENSAVATSGDYRNVRMYNGKRISHTIDPKTCRPVDNPPPSCSVLADDCMTADALATAVMVMGAKKGLEFCEQHGFELNVYNRNSDNKVDSVATAGFPIRADQEAERSSEQTQSIWPAFVGALVVFSLAIAGMAVGAIFNDRPITGSCGGIASKPNEDGSSSCSLCEKPVVDCPDQASEQDATDHDPNETTAAC